ncbi:branched-chain amino acid transport system II carrier protein [Stutzerimonas kirkiae]|uniref:Branched-chain amino acid transport system carrier protein n=1 Tax=Stutzerimonas kirkiae TaxID=2211392 RepID=A0A4Q9R019_9GAMM|nr:branched-chain amino acid transport system II carrier protein [Stutzerimonas kirkiae]TBU91316.1 hypothetical protein DNJ96_16270 [Stutzerimonas kirkiae]TBV00414.1 hypothetical protein DNJ95_14750 [Stutzerimonas kirkiae]TBV11780.1 hypothetical protein DNK08_02350 [Stutzerimonas kirkiae]TBV15293.1 hypothetical protein DNK01_06335 [Stutzerimonas kirkiae]
MTTGVGLLVACGEFFSDLLRVPDAMVAWVFSLFSFAVSNIGLNQLIGLSVPVLASLYPLAIVLVGLSLLDRFWLSSSRVMIPVMAVTLLFGIIDGLRSSGFASDLPWGLERLPLADLGMGWVAPVALALAIIVDRAHGRPQLQERS